jgi:anti-sigma regulatory factor (Ser/Thr protein kinase)
MGVPRKALSMRLDQTASMNGSPPALDGFDALLWSAEGRAADGPLADVEVAMDAKAPGVARRIVSTCLAESVVPLTLEHARLIVSELVTNSLRHSGVPIGEQMYVRIHVWHDRCRLEVQDSGHEGVVGMRPFDALGGGGLGLRLVEQLSEEWGVIRRAGGPTRVWAQLSRTSAPSPSLLS